MLATGWAYSAQRIRNDRERTMQTESDRLQSVAVALGTTTFAMLSDGVGSAVVRANEIESLGGLESVSERDLTPALGTALMGGEYVRSIFIADSARFARGGRSGAYDVSAARPAWFKPAVSPETDVWVGTPVADPDQPGTDSMVVPVAQRVRAGGRSDLWAGALFDFRAFDSLRKQLGSPGGILLLGSDGALLAAMQDISPEFVSNQSYASSPLFQQAARELQNGWDRGVVRGFAPKVGASMIFGWARVRQFPVVIATGRPLAAVLAPWERRMITTLVVTGAFSALVLAMTLLLNHSLRALRSRELHYRTLFNNTSFSVLLSEGDHFIAANDTALRMFGIPDLEAVRELDPEAISPPEQPDGRPSSLARRKYIEQAMRDGNATFEWLHRRVDNGEAFPAEVDMNVIAQDKALLRLSIVHDLTEAKRAERERRESEGRYQALVDALPEAVLVHRGGELLFGNVAARTLIGAAPDDSLKGVPVTSFALEPDRKLLIERTRAILEHGVPAEPRETRIRRLDGTVIWVEVQGVRVQYAGAPAVQTLLRNITARKEQEEAEAARVVRMQRQSEMLLRVASHSSDAGLTGLRSALEGICVDS
ncbi:MAG TPA: PAS domain S-box protein, partial [Steroidobacteraceae bacterium]|nr:PAS domain S-box protein [Steroidobacteraceae bacterium]